MVQAIYMVLIKIGGALFSLTFVFVTAILYMLYHRSKQKALTSLTPFSYDPMGIILKVIVQGILAGILGSIIIVVLGLPLRISPYFVLLLPIAIFLSFFNMRYLCFSYSAGILGIMTILLSFLDSQGMHVPVLELNPSGLIALVGVLHLMESLLIAISGGDETIPVVIKKDGVIGVGYILQKYWPLPIALLILSPLMDTENVQYGLRMHKWWPLLESKVFAQGFMYGLMPLTAMVGYGDFAVSSLPKEKSRATAIRLFIYSLGLILLSLLSVNTLWLQFTGLILMPVAHEFLIIMDQKRETKKPPLLTVPKKGVRVVKVLDDSHAGKMGLHPGDIIKKINNIEVLHYRQMEAILKEYYTFMWVEIEDVKGGRKTLEYTAFPDGVDKLGIVHLPRQPHLVYRVEELYKSKSFLDPILKK